MLWRCLRISGVAGAKMEDAYGEMGRGALRVEGASGSLVKLAPEGWRQKRRARNVGGESGLRVRMHVCIRA